MFEDMVASTPTGNDDDAFDILQDLSQNTSEEIRRQRAHFRVAIKACVIVRPGNSSERLSFKVRGVTGDISQGGCSMLLPVPVNVGDVYQLEFDRETIGLPLTYARCVRCRLIREDAFEIGFAFFAPVALPERLRTAATANTVG